MICKALILLAVGQVFANALSSKEVKSSATTITTANGRKVIYYNGVPYMPSSTATSASSAASSTAPATTSSPSSSASSVSSASSASTPTSPAAAVNSASSTSASYSTSATTDNAAPSATTESSAAPSSTTSSAPTSGSSSSMVPTKDEFMNAVTSNGYPQPTDAQYDAFAKGVDSNTFSSKREVAMFLAEILWESAGLTAKVELDCVSSPCTQYNTAGDPAGKSYYGRGYIQLTWSSNYKAASEDIYSDDRLYTDPDQVSSDEDIAWAVTFQYWRTRVHTDAKVLAGQFGAATNDINGGLECCSGCSTATPEKRFELYKKVLPAFNISETAIESGCYN